MSKDNIVTEEKEYLKKYDIAQYERPSVATDMVIFSIMNDGERKNLRKPQKKALKVLMVKRAMYPFKNCWALPGGFCKQGEDIYETAKNKLYEKTHIKNAHLSLVDVFGEANRDPRGWILSSTFMALVNAEEQRPIAGTDTEEAKWFSINYDESIVKKEISDDAAEIITDYQMYIALDTEDISFSVRIREHKTYQNCHESLRYEILEGEGLAFDHAKILLLALLKLKKSLENDVKIVFDLMPKVFTLTQLQSAVEIILGHELLVANFRRKVSSLVKETEFIDNGNSYRPAKLFKRNINTML